MIRNNIKFIKLTTVKLGMYRPFWFRSDLITKIFIADNLTYISYLGNGESAEATDYRISETPEQIIAEIEKINNSDIK